ncbi:AMP-dependent synthetase/ligase [Bifidobacterium callimiconis]|uniref:AMP-binding protein n=1 Tax=Bifidobacterium callimiconis TaxID=2306973 RepID=A0A430FHV2_9BIFI|nr:AMP-dependent synthetase/ligase [Bifidobacterium callimiconis]MBT1177984.1 long-chain fatty acid--CoA ligase [Bifidobacterium callimiconis]RSX52278.1 AMP-binding protein [Bifidobacterium callimiconis]
MLREYSVDVIHPTTEKDTIYSLLAHRVERDPDDLIAQWQDESRQWHDVKAGEMLDAVRGVAKGLMGLGVHPGDRIVIYSPTCYQWGVVDFACAAIGVVSVPIYETDSAKQAANIIEDVEPRIAFAGDHEHAQTLELIRKDHDSLGYVFNFKADGVAAISDFGKSVNDDDLDEAIARVRADDLATIVYTSGSTGKPKGAMLSHRNFTHTVLNGYEVLNDMLYQPSRLLLFLPLAHCFARYIQYVAIGSHGVVGYIPGAKHLLADLRGFKPTYLLGVPRVFEKVYNAASQKAGTGMSGRIFANAVNHFVQWSKQEQENGHHSVADRIRHAFYMKTVGSSIRSALGPNLKYLACGGAPLNIDLAHFFNGFDGITFIQGYGMTETAAPCMVNFQDANEIGSVGLPGCMEVKLADDDELMIRGASVFLGYYRQPELTAEVLQPDGWLHTGDLARIDDRGFTFITGRKKDIIITAGGKNVSPAPLEDTIATCPIVSHAVVIGDGRPFISALIALDPDMLASWMESQGLDGSMTPEEIADSDAVRAFVQQYVDQANATVSRAESVRKFVILDRDFNQDDGTLTPSMKVVRPAVLKRYAEVIDKVLYAPKSGSRPQPTASAQFLERVQENALPRIKEAGERLEPVIDQAKSMGDSLNVVSKRLKSFDEDQEARAGESGTLEDGENADKTSDKE